MKEINEILNTLTGKKMIANLSMCKDMDKSKLSEMLWIDELPLQQQELFDTIYQLVDITRRDLAIRLINNKPIVK
jgi:hypothetical protein